MPRRVRPVPEQLLSVLFQYEAGVGWVAHCLEYSIVTHAKTFEKARAAVIEAVKLALAMDREDGIDSRSRPRAPLRDWLIWQRVRAEGQPLSTFMGEASRRRLLVAGLMRLGAAEDPAHAEGELAPDWLTQALAA